jgi:hypothetical protein
MRPLLIVVSYVLSACGSDAEAELFPVAAHGASCRGWDVDVTWVETTLQHCVSSVVQRWTYEMPAMQHCEALAARTTRLHLPRAGECKRRRRELSFDPLWPMRWSHQIIGCPELGPIVLNAVQTCARDAVQDAAKR